MTLDSGNLGKKY